MKHLVLGACIAASLVACGGAGDRSENSTQMAHRESSGVRHLGQEPLANTPSDSTYGIPDSQSMQLGNSGPLDPYNASLEESIMTVYQVAFGRTPDAGSLDYWFDVGRGGATLEQIAASFTSSAEFVPIAQKPDEAFVEGLYQNAFGREGDAAGIAYWTESLTRGASRADLILQFSRVAGLSDADLRSLCETLQLAYWCGK